MRVLRYFCDDQPNLQLSGYRDCSDSCDYCADLRRPDADVRRWLYENADTRERSHPGHADRPGDCADVLGDCELNDQYSGRERYSGGIPMAVAYASMRRRSCRICSRIWSSGSPVIYSYLRRQYRSEASCKESFANMFINPISPDSLLGVICAVRDGIFPIFMTFGVIAFVVAGALYLMAAGDQTKVAK